MPISPRAGRPAVAPEEVVIELLRRGHLEAVHRDTLRVHPTHHVRIVPSLPAASNACKHHQHPPRTLSRKPSLVLGQQPHPLSEQRATLPLLLHAPLEGGVEVLVRVTFAPGLTRNGSMNSATLFWRLSAIRPPYPRLPPPPAEPVSIQISPLRQRPASATPRRRNEANYPSDAGGTRSRQAATSGEPAHELG